MLADLQPRAMVPKDDPQPTFTVQRAKEGLWYILADWPDDGVETAKVCATEDECHRWIRTMSVGWASGRKQPEE